MTAGHPDEWIASRIFDIALEESAANQGFDGRFRSGPLRQSTVDIKWYMKRTGLLDISEFPGLEYDLVLAGPPSSAGKAAREVPPVTRPPRSRPGPPPPATPIPARGRG